MSSTGAEDSTRRPTATAEGQLQESARRPAATAEAAACSPDTTESLAAERHGEEGQAGREQLQELKQLGPVALVGAGPGDPELLTLKAARLLKSADVVLYDSLISEEILGLVPASAQLVNVGKRCGDKKDRGLQQQEIHNLMLEHSLHGRRVVRLKAGDPFLYGRGGEEVEFLVRHHVPLEVVPGITSALGASASCQMPLTHRSLNVNQVRFLVGQSQARKLPNIDWSALARGVTQETTVFYMGFQQLAAICQRLREHGAAEETPMAAIESATTPQERVFRGTLKTLPEIAAQQEAGRGGGPVLLMLGPTVAFPEQLEQLAGGRPWKRARVVDNVDGR